MILNPQLTNQSFSFCTAEQLCNVLSLSLRHSKGGREFYVASSCLDEACDREFGVWEPPLSLRIVCFLDQGQRREQGAFYCDGESAETEKK